ncbi:AAA family ATPase [Novosphingobium profundi]|uniref:AAA family ATPase n=1 Tax=Novosphingobium profundi TaxID=1774954 RepID=UPI001CFE7B05|nr:AAA family ATPase [Novosphingobium profundi]
MREIEFKEWLTDGGAESTKALNVRIHALRKIEQNLSRLGFTFADLEEAYTADRFVSLIQKLGELRENARQGGDYSRILLPESKAADRRLSYWQSWLKRYGAFLSGEEHGEGNADRIRLHVLEHYIEPARERDEASVKVHVGTVNDALALKKNWRNVFQSLTNKKFLNMADLPPPERIGAKDSPATHFIFDLSGGIGEAAILQHFRVNSYFNEAISNWTENQKQEFVRIAIAVHQAGLDWWFVNIDHTPVRFGRRDKGAARAHAVIGYLRAQEAAVNLNQKNNAVRLIEERQVPFTSDAVSQLCSALQSRSSEISARLPVDPPRAGYWPDEFRADEIVTDTTPEGSYVSTPTNLILYGPPGTGKTYATAQEAVRLCDENVPEDRDELMALYRRLQKENRIAFLTFHQSMAYEDFVEGLRPDTKSSEGEDSSSSGGFQLVPAAGIFRKIARLAEEAAGLPDKAASGSKPVRLDVGQRQVFKMSLGRAGIEEHIYEDALETGVISLGWGGGIDWTDHDTYEAIHARWNQDHPGTNGNDGNISQTYRFRVSMKVGDLVLISAGNTQIRAIAEVTGDYSFAPAAEYTNQRPVRWLKVFDDPIAVDTVYSRPFTQRSCYRLREEFLKRGALQTLLSNVSDPQEFDIEPAPESAQAAGPANIPQFVLIIDEINRANVSKVFGELITLLEPDKRLGMTNALTVTLPYSRREFGVPANLHIIGTMNTADRSIARLDTALRRRFTFRELAPDVTVAAFQEAERATGIALGKVLTAINERIEYLLDREHRIGHAFFIGCTTRKDVDGVMREKIIPLLQEFFFEDWGMIAAVLGTGFVEGRPLRAPRGLEKLQSFTMSEARTRWRVRDDFAEDAYTTLIAGRVEVSDEGPADELDEEA